MIVSIIDRLITVFRNLLKTLQAVLIMVKSQMKLNNFCIHVCTGLNLQFGVFLSVCGADESPPSGAGFIGCYRLQICSD